MSSGFNGLPNIKMEDGGMGSLGLKVKHKTFYISTSDQTRPALPSPSDCNVITPSDTLRCHFWSSS